MSATPDRIKAMLDQDLVTGIDFIDVDPSQTLLNVHFIRSAATLQTPLPGSVLPEDLNIYSPGEKLPVIEVASVDWSADKEILKVTTRQKGDFTLYRFRINDARIDDYFNDVTFSFKANCPSDLDCRPCDHHCPPDELVDFPVDYQARDFWSFRRALLDFAALRYPDWPDRLEADAGVMMAELMSALGDEMSYYQDRVSREAYLETATQRRSIRRHARLIDYQLHDGLGSKGWIDVTVDSVTHSIDAGTPVSALSDGGTSIDFEIGNGIADYADPTDVKKFLVDSSVNQLDPHLWDQNQTCLPVGTTGLFIEGHYHAAFEALGLPKWVLLQTSPPDPAQPVRKQLVHITEATDTKDAVLNTDITHIVWEKEQALTYEFDLTVLQIRCNIVPVTAGFTHTAFFIIKEALSPLDPDKLAAFAQNIAGETVNRIGHDGTETYLFTLPGSNALPLVYLGDDPHQFNSPEIILEQVEFDAGTKTWTPQLVDSVWQYMPALVGIHSSNPADLHYTFDDGTWQRVVGYQRVGNEIVHPDYAIGSGVTLRFGDDEFGKVPEAGSVFRVRYRLGGTRRSNVAADSIQSLPPSVLGISITNPLPSSGGWDAETPEELRQLATEAFRAITYRAVRPEDYAEAAERLPWVQKAGAAFRWTGSWLTAFVTPDPKGKVTLDPPDRMDLIHQLDRFRQAGREVSVMDPIYASLDLEIDICVSPDAYPGEVKERVTEALIGHKCGVTLSAYFSPDRFTFGTSLERSTLEAAIQHVQGVNAVGKITFRRKGWFGWRIFRGMQYDPGKNTIIRVANDPLHPDRGSLKIHTYGGL